MKEEVKEDTIEVIGSDELKKQIEEMQKDIEKLERLREIKRKAMKFDLHQLTVQAKDMSRI